MKIKFLDGSVRDANCLSLARTRDHLHTPSRSNEPMNANTCLVRRDLRGVTLFLCGTDRTSNAFDWSADKSRAMRFDSVAAALNASERAFTAGYGVDSAVVDANDRMLVRSRAEIGAVRMSPLPQLRSEYITL